MCYYRLDTAQVYWLRIIKTLLLLPEASLLASSHHSVGTIRHHRLPIDTKQPMDAHPPGPMANLADPQIKQEIKQEPNDEDDFELAKQLTMNADMEIVQEMFSGIEPKHVENLWKSKLSMQSAQAIIDHLLDEVDKGHPWPKIEKPQISLKRKRSVTSEGEEDYKATHPDRITASYLSVA